MTAPALPAAPVFVFGALRSGTTMLRLMLDAHPGLSNPGEADFLFDHLDLAAAPPRYDREALTDSRIFRDRGLTLAPGLDGLDLLADLLAQLDAKAPGLTSLNIHRHPERLAAALPGARVIHLLRDPRDVARSAIGMGWAGAAWHGVEGWIATEAAWDRAAPGFAAGAVLELRFEDLLADPEARLGEICAFLGVPYAPEMLAYPEASTYDAPDPKLAQQWRRKASAREVAEVEARAGDLMRRRGYPPEGDGAAPGPLRRAELALRNRLAVWRFRARRYGPALYAAEKAARSLGLSTQARALGRRMQEIDRRHLK